MLKNQNIQSRIDLPNTADDEMIFDTAYKTQIYNMLKNKREHQKYDNTTHYKKDKEHVSQYRIYFQT